MGNNINTAELELGESIYVKLINVDSFIGYYERYFFSAKEARDAWKRMHKAIFDYALENKITMPQSILNDYQKRS